MTLLTRRTFSRQLGWMALGAGIAGRRAGAAPASTPGPRTLKTCLACGSIGVRANQVRAIELAHRHGFEAVEANGDSLAGLTETALAELKADLKVKGLVFGAAGLPVEFRGDESRFQSSLHAFPAIAAGLQRAGVTRVRTWITPGDDRLTYVQNLRQHARRLREVAQVVQAHQLRLGLEYVGPRTSFIRRRHPFIHTLAEMRDLIAEIGSDAVGLVLDSWHWYTAGDTEAELLALTARDVVSVDLNDAPAGVKVEEQLDNRRELPMATGVIDVATFLNALQRIGYDGPVRVEPFNQALNALEDDDACAAAITALKRAMALIRTG